MINIDFDNISEELVYKAFGVDGNVDTMTAPVRISDERKERER